MNRSHSLEMIVKQLKHSGSIKAHIVSCGGLKMQKFLLAETEKAMNKRGWAHCSFLASGTLQTQENCNVPRL